MIRRTIASLAGAAALAAGFALAQPAVAQKTLRLVPHSDLKILDPIWTTAFISRNHGYMVYDTLFAQDDKLQIRPQMVERWTVSDDKLTWTFTLREGLEWHDGQPVTAEDCIASIRRWGARDALGQQLMAFAGDMRTVDARTFQIVLKEPFGMMLESLGKPSSNVPFMMPKRIAETAPDKQIDDYVGSGPFVFKRDEWRPGDRIVYVKNAKYRPRSEPASGLAGGKAVNVDRVEWVWMPDPLTAVNALLTGEIDLIEVPPPDLFPVLRKDRNVELFGWNKLGSQMVMRFNHLHPPFNNPKARQAALLALSQDDLLKAQVGDPTIYSVCSSPLVCGTPLAKSYGDFTIKPDFERARQLLKESGYDGTPVVMLHQTDLQSSNQVQPVSKQAMERAGFKVEMQAMDWQSVVARRAKKDAPSQGGWHIFFTTTTAVDAANPIANSFLRADCDKAWFGWPCDEEIEKIRAAFVREADEGKRLELAHRLQDRAFELASYGWLGQYKAFGAYRKDRLSGWLESPVPVFWNISKK